MRSTVDDEYYRTNILPLNIDFVKGENILPYPDQTILMHDGAKCYTVKATLRQLEKKGAWFWNDWPGNSDLNVIEHIWDILQDSIFNEPSPRNREQLIVRINNAEII